MKIAVVTGASSGIGREFARQIPQLYRHLDELWVVARRTERLKELEKEAPLPVRIFDGDLRRDYIYERLQKELDRQNAEIRMMVNAAGYGKTGRFEEIPLADQLGMIDLNCRSLTKMTGICLPHLHRGSRIVNIASAAAFHRSRDLRYMPQESLCVSSVHGAAEELKGKGDSGNCRLPRTCGNRIFSDIRRTAGKIKDCFPPGSVGSGTAGIKRRGKRKTCIRVREHDEGGKDLRQDPSGSAACKV